MPPFRVAPVLRLAHLSGLCAMALLTAGVHAPAMAQSRFIASTLKPSFLGKVEANQLIDSQNRVFAYLSHYRGIGLEFGFGGSKTRWVFKYDAYPSMWSASTSASLSPTKLLKERLLRVIDLSSHGSKLLVNRVFPLPTTSYFAPVVFDTVTRQPLNYVIDGSASAHLNKRSNAASVNDQGWVADSITAETSTIDNTQTRAARWRPGHAVEMLAIPEGMTGSAATSINAAGEVAGWVEQRNADAYRVRRAAKWGVDGTLQLLDTSPDGISWIEAIADNGTVLMVRSAMSDEGSHRTTLALHSTDGQVQTLPIAGDLGFNSFDVGPRSLSPDGDTVVGTRRVLGAPPGRADDRAFIFKDGVMDDLTAYASARGLKLPTGTHLWTATAVNAQGSITTGYDTSSGNFVALKLTAVP